MSDYWTRQTITRRAALRGVALAGGGLTALSIVGCGGGSSKGSTSTPSGQAGAVDSTKGKSGGSLKLMLSGPLPSLTVIDKVSGSPPRMGGLVLSGLLGNRWGQDSVDPRDYSVEPDLAQALPEQPDQLTYTFKLRPNAKFHNGRAVAAEDVKYSFNRYATSDQSVYRPAWQNWLDRVDTPDAQTVTVKTKFPYADALQSMAPNSDGYIFCKEFEEGPDTATKMVGSGPYTFASADPPVSWTYRKNPDYYLKPYPYFDEIVGYSAPDPVKRIANFTTRQVQQAWVVYADDRDTIKQARPDAKNQLIEWTASGTQVRTDKPPFNDKRVRQAMSMTIDRKKVRDAVTQGQGEPDQFFPVAWSQILGTHRVKDLGAAARYSDYNPAEAKKLLSAAGIDKPIEFDLTHYEPAVVGQWFTDQATLAQATWRELGVANVRLVVQSAAVFNSQVVLGRYDGMALNPAPPISGIQTSNALKDLLYWGPNGEHSPKNTSYVNEPRLNPLLEKQIRQLKLEERQATNREIEAITSEELYRIYFSTSTQNWFTDPSLINVSQPGEITVSYRYAMRWWSNI